MPDSAEQDTFNERELEVLRLIAEGWSNREIADELIISVNTVRWYNKQIYSKLGVHSRTLAIARARDMGLLAIDSSGPAAAVAEQEPTVQPAPVLRHNLPAQLTPFIGRQRELNELADLLTDPDVRLITIIGPGGIGKTRLAIETARSQIDAVEHGVYLVSLAPLDVSGSVSYFGATMSDFIIQAVADAIGLSFYAGREPGRQLIEFMRDRQMLLVMDNFEHLLAGVDVLDEMLQAAPKLQVLATSRETLGIYGEAVYPLTGLPLTTGEAAAAQEHDSLHLFVQSARRARPDFVLEPANRPIAARICELVGGMPLAIELAAGWVRSMWLEEIVEELTRGLDILETRTHSIRAAFDRSWNLLTDKEQAAFATMSIFQGGCTREAAEAVAGAGPRMLTTLVDKSLLWYGPDGRYSMHELLRQYGGEKLEQITDRAAARDRHCAYYAAFAGKWGRGLREGQQLEGLAAIKKEMENIRSAWRWAVQHQNADALSELGESWYFFDIRNLWYEGNELYGLAVDNWTGDQDSVVYGKLLAGQSQFAWRLGLWEQALALCEASIDVLTRAGAEAETVLPRLNLGNIVSMRGDLDAGEQLYLENLAIAERHWIRWAQALLLCNLSIVAESREQYDLADERLQQQLAIAQEIGDHASIALAKLNLSEIAQRQKNYREASRYCQDSLDLSTSIGQQHIMANSMNRLGTIAAAQHRFADARRMIEAAVAVNRKNGHRYYTVVNLISLTSVAIAERDLQLARRCVHESLKLALEIRSYGLISEIFLIAAELLLNEGNLERAIELLAAVRYQPTTRHKQDRDQAQQLCDDLQSELPEALFNAALERGKSQKLEGLVNDLIGEMASA
jgi:predicted ATPase/DNA-binding CsgD family transcriptional regulator